MVSVPDLIRLVVPEQKHLIEVIMLDPYASPGPELTDAGIEPATTEVPAAAPTPVPALPEGVITESQAYGELSRQYGKFTRSGNADRQRSIEYVDSSLSCLHVGRRYEAITTTRGTEKIPGSRNSRTVETSESNQGRLIGFSVEGGHLNLVLQDDDTNLHHIPFDPDAYVDYFSQFEGSATSDEIVFSQHSAEKLRITRL